MDGNRLYDYDQLMVLLPRAPRPLRLLFEGAGAALAAPPEDDSAFPVPSSQSPLVLSLPSSQKQSGKGTDRAPGGGSDSYSGSSSSSDSDSDSGSGSARSSDSSRSSTSGYSSSRRGSTSETDAVGGETNSAAAAAAVVNGGRMSDGKATRKEEQPRPNPPAGGVVSKRPPAAVSGETSVSPNSGVLAAPGPAAGSQKTAVPPGSIKTPRGEGKPEDLDEVVTNGECYSTVDGSKRVIVSDGRGRSGSNGGTDRKEGKVEGGGPRREDAKGVVAGPGQGNGNPRVHATEAGRVEREAKAKAKAKVEEVVSREASRREIVQAEEALEAASAVTVSASSRDKKEKRAVKSGKRNGIARDGDGHGSSRGGNGDVKGAPKEEGRAATSSSQRSLAAKDGSSKDDSSVFTQGAKVSWVMTSEETCGDIEGIRGNKVFSCRPT